MTSAMTKSSHLLPDPEPRDVSFTLISVDDHLVEPPDMFEGRLPKKFEAHAPRVIKLADGSEPWVYENALIPQYGTNAVVGQSDRDALLGPTGFAQMRRGCWDVHERIRDMDLAGIWGSVCFPSIVSGFCGRVFSQSYDQDLGLAVTRAWNDWMFEAWHGAYPDRLVAMGITWLNDPKVGAEEILRNAARGFTAVTLPEMPHLLGYPSLHEGYWDPILAACEETDTTICLHVGSSGLSETANGAPMGLSVSLFSVSSMQACADWVWSGALVRYPKLRVVMAEGGIGWVPMLLDRFEFVLDHAGGPSLGSTSWRHELSPNEILLRNFYFAMLDEPRMLALRDVIGVDHIMVEVDYPHADSTWPDTQPMLRSRFHGLPDEETRLMTHANAARVFRTPLPGESQPEHSSE